MQNSCTLSCEWPATCMLIITHIKWMLNSMNEEMLVVKENQIQGHSLCANTNRSRVYMYVHMNSIVILIQENLVSKSIYH